MKPYRDQRVSAPWDEIEQRVPLAAPDNPCPDSKVFQPTHFSGREGGAQGPHSRQICRLWSPDSRIRAGTEIRPGGG